MPYSHEYHRYPAQMGLMLRQWALGGYFTVRVLQPSRAAAFSVRQRFYSFSRALRRHKAEEEAGELYEIARRLSMSIFIPGTDTPPGKDWEGPVDLAFHTQTEGKWASSFDAMLAQMTGAESPADSEARLLETLKEEKG